MVDIWVYCQYLLWWVGAQKHLSLFLMQNRANFQGISGGYGNRRSG